jgi:hypothetical protein
MCMSQPENPATMKPDAAAAPSIALIGSSSLPDTPSISLIVIHAPPAKGSNPIHLPELRQGPPAAILSELLLLFALCILWSGVVKAHRRLS